ncbi:MAG: methylated-DNA--[protein]-cysteine S-methyltransferase [Candidatus Krumholzibacteriia bacterium]
MQLRIAEIESPIGTILLVASDDALVALDFADGRSRMLSHLAARFGSVKLVPAADPNGYSSRVRAYLRGDLDALDDVPADTGGTAFQRRVWAALRRIPHGTTTSYGKLAAQVGRPGAARAVGVTNSRNPIALVIPCHRVIGADGSLTGYAGGLDRKR